MTPSPLQKHHYEQTDKRLLELFAAYKRGDVLTIFEYIHLITELATDFPFKQSVITTPTHLTNQQIHSFETHKGAFTLIEEMNGPEDATEYCRDNDLPIRLCPSCGITPSYQNTCFGCSRQLPDHANEISTTPEVER